MTLLEAIPLRHSVRRYLDRPLLAEVVKQLRDEIDKVNKESGLHIQFVTDEPKAFTGILSYGKFSGVKNYFVIAGPKSDTLDRTAGYYGEHLVLFAQTLGLNTCWVGLTYRKIAGTYELVPGDKIVCYIALGYGETQGNPHKTKTVEQLGNVGPDTPAWFRDGVEAARLAPTAINQQKFHFNYVAPAAPGEKAKVIATPGRSLAGYTRTDLGIACCNFELAAGKENFEWA
ncbi:MAG: nitroreductase family protein [Muribaculaceae bacterium]